MPRFDLYKKQKNKKKSLHYLFTLPWEWCHNDAETSAINHNNNNDDDNNNDIIIITIIIIISLEPHTIFRKISMRPNFQKWQIMLIVRNKTNCC